MTNEEIQELIRMVVDSGIAEIEVQRGENRVRIRRTATSKSEVIVPHVVAPMVPTGSVPPQPSAGGDNAGHPPSGAGHAASAAPPSDTVLVKSPIVGTFYDGPSPGAPPFVKVGDQVEAGQVLCIIESMKLMNEIEAELSGTIVSKLMENGRPVEYGEALFAVRPR